MTDTTRQSPTGLVTGSRWALLILTGLFTLGAFAQFFLVGMSFFDDAALWNDHAGLGHILGLFTYVLWIPAVLGKAGGRIITACAMLFILFMAQYAFIEIDNSVVNAFHPLNGSILLVLGFWVTIRTAELIRTPEASRTGPRRADYPEGISA